MKKTNHPKKLFSLAPRLTLLFFLTSTPLMSLAAHESDINFATPDDHEFFIPESLKPVSINGRWYLQTTTPAPFHDYKTTISTLDGREVSSITYPPSAIHHPMAKNYGMAT
jgi:hypothetical protein